MNRIGGPSGLPHSRTCSRRPPPPCTVVPSSGSASGRRVRLPVIVVPPRARRSQPIVACEERRRIGRRALSFGLGLPYLRTSGAHERALDRAVAARYWPEWRLAERGVRRTGTRARGARARARCDAGAGAVRPCSSLEKPASARPGWRPSSRRRARDAGFEVLLGRSIDLVGTELPYQPFVEALRPLGDPWQVDGGRGGSQLKVFEETLALLTERAASTPVLLVLEDLHWADTSTLDLVVFLAHNLDDRRVLLLATYRADEPSSADRMHRLAEGVRRSGSALVLELGPLEPTTSWRRCSPPTPTLPPPALTDAIVARVRGQSLLRRGAPRRRRGDRGDAPAWPARPAASARGPARPIDAEPAASGRGRRTRRRVSAAARDCRAARARRARVAAPGGRARRPRRRSGDGSFRFRHALLAEAIYATILPGEREELHARLADELARSGAAAPAELAPHWAAAGRTRRGARRLGRSGAPGRGRLRPRRGARPPRAGARAVGHRAGRGRARPGSTSPSSARGPPSSPAKSVPPRARSSSAGERSSSSARTIRTVRPSSMCASVSTSTQTGSERRLPRRGRARGRARAGGAALAGARVFAGVARRGR